MFQDAVLYIPSEGRRIVFHMYIVRSSYLLVKERSGATAIRNVKILCKISNLS